MPVPLFADDFDEDAFAAAAVEFAVEDLFPGAEVEFAFGDGDNNFAAHELAFHVGVGIVLAGAVVLILRSGFVRREFFEPDIVVMQETVFGVVDVDAGGLVRCPFAICESGSYIAPIPMGGKARRPLRQNPNRSASTLS